MLLKLYISQVCISTNWKSKFFSSCSQVF